MKRTLLVASFFAALFAAVIFVPSRADAGLFGGRAAATPSPSPAPLPTATPEPPQIAIPRLIDKLKANPNDRDAMTQLAAQYLGIGRPDLSLPITQKLLQLGEKTAAVYYYDGSAQEALGNIPAAIADLESASNLEPTNLGILSTLTQLYLRVNHSADAERVANRAVTFNKTAPQAYMNLGVVYATEQKFDDARKEFEQAYTLDPKDVTPLLQEAQTYASQNAIPSALTIVARAIAADPKNVQALVFKADLLAKQNNPAAAAAAYDDAVAAASSNDEKVGILIRKAAMYASLKQAAQAEGVFTAAIAQYPTVSAAHTAFGEYWLANHQPVKAEQQFLAALQVNKDDPQALQDLGEYYLSSGKANQAIAYLKHLTDVSPSAQAFALLGQAYITTRNYSAAKEACGKSFQIQRTPDTLGCVAGSDFNMKNYKEASQIFDILDKNVKKFLDGNPQYLYMMGVSYTQTNQKGKAIEAYKRLLKDMRPGTKEYKQIQRSIAMLARAKPAPKKPPVKKK